MLRTYRTPTVNRMHDPLDGTPIAVVTDPDYTAVWTVERDAPNTTILIKRRREAKVQILRGRDLPIGVCTHDEAVTWCTRKAEL